MSTTETNKYVARAFLSCSLRPEDKPFIDFVERILLSHGIEPVGTVGKYSASPTNPAVLMKQNIPECDFVVVCATPRYLQRDLQTGQISSGLSEMIHIETGIAYAFNKPVVAFVQEGTSVGNFLPNITQYITLNGALDDFQSKKALVMSLLNSAYRIAKMVKSKIEQNQGVKILGKVALTGLAIYGGYKLVEKIFANDYSLKR